MSNRDQSQQFTRKQIGIIFKIAFLEAMALSLIIPSSTSSGETPAAVTAKQSGQASCTIPTNLGQCSVTITFSPAFAVTPTFKVNFFQPNVPLQQQGSVAQICFICPTGTGVGYTWTNMPAAQTELFGDANGEHQVIVDDAGFRSALLSVNCLTASNQAGAILKVQHSEDGTTWNDLALNAGGGNVPIGTTALCGLGGTTNWQCVGGACPGNGFPTFISQPNTFLRVVGSGGGGVGDNPRFAAIQMFWGVTLSPPGNLVVTALSSTSATVKVQLASFPITAQTITLDWFAEVA